MALCANVKGFLIQPTIFGIRCNVLEMFHRYGFKTDVQNFVEMNEVHYPSLNQCITMMVEEEEVAAHQHLHL